MEVILSRPKLRHHGVFRLNRDLVGIRGFYRQKWNKSVAINRQHDFHWKRAEDLSPQKDTFRVKRK